MRLRVGVIREVTLAVQAATCAARRRAVSPNAVRSSVRSRGLGQSTLGHLSLSPER